MASLTKTNQHSNFHLDTQTKWSLWAVPIGRFLFSLLFIVSGFNHFTSGSIGYAASQGIPLANILVPLTGVMAIAGGLSILLGYHARFGALILLLFLVPVTLLMHNFWSISDPAVAQAEMAHFMKNLSLIGTTIIFAFYGAGPLSMDNRLNKKLSRSRS